MTDKNCAVNNKHNMCVRVATVLVRFANNSFNESCRSVIPLIFDGFRLVK